MYYTFLWFWALFWPSVFVHFCLNREEDRIIHSTEITQMTLVALLCAPPIVSGHHALHPHLCLKCNNNSNNPNRPEIITRLHWRARVRPLPVPRVTVLSTWHPSKWTTMQQLLQWLLLQTTLGITLIMHATTLQIQIITTLLYPFLPSVPHLTSHPVETAESYPSLRLI